MGIYEKTVEMSIEREYIVDVYKLLAEAWLSGIHISHQSK